MLHVYAKTGVASTPTLVNVWAGIHSDNVIQDTASMRYMPESVREFWTSAATAPFNAAFVEHLQPVYAHSRLLTLALKNAGIPVLAGTDVGNPFLIPGVALHQELMLLNEAGLSPLDSLRAATLNPASVFGFEDSLGQVKTGFIADLVLLDSNPIVDMSAVSDISAVVRGGKLYNRNTLNQILSDLQKR
ncbi:amidohydrolase family protein [Alteromonas sp. H39]|uniref:amidohydrolase family protein n=1 Tax=Alteromonas sp. H39 TaxID=3389876 RepID=UPI0039DF4C91